MKKNRSKSTLSIFCMIVATVAVMAYSAKGQKVILPGTTVLPGNRGIDHKGPLVISGKLTQHKILQGSDGRVNLALTLHSEDEADTASGTFNHVDMVVVLDRSGSMKGRKINDARRALLKLLNRLSPRDRFALVAYADGVRQFSGLHAVTEAHRQEMASVIQQIRPGGGTNLGAGLQAGVDLLVSAGPTEKSGKVILISDGLANRGIREPNRLGRIAKTARGNEFAVSTVGVGIDFNEVLMTRIADQGAGNYYYLENPAAFADVFQKEFYASRSAAITGLSVHVPLESGMSLVHASGYPIAHESRHAVFYPGNLRAGQTRKIFLTFRVPSQRTGDFEIGRIQFRYLHNGAPFETALGRTFQIACIKDPRRVLSSIDKSAWSDQVISEDYNRLKQEVAGDIRAGKKAGPWTGSTSTVRKKRP